MALKSVTTNGVKHLAYATDGNGLKHLVDDCDCCGGGGPTLGEPCVMCNSNGTPAQYSIALTTDEQERSIPNCPNIPPISYIVPGEIIVSQLNVGWCYNNCKWWLNIDRPALTGGREYWRVRAAISYYPNLVYTVALYSLFTDGTACNAFDAGFCGADVGGQDMVGTRVFFASTWPPHNRDCLNLPQFIIDQNTNYIGCTSFSMVAV